MNWGMAGVIIGIWLLLAILALWLMLLIVMR